MADYATIPIFPLQIVVFPGEMVPLHIFEERYKQMFADVRAARERGEVLLVGIILLIRFRPKGLIPQTVRG